eukprot:15306528-Ditylum_brightwellii.AAC.1
MAAESKIVFDTNALAERAAVEAKAAAERAAHTNDEADIARAKFLEQRANAQSAIAAKVLAAEVDALKAKAATEVRFAEQRSAAQAMITKEKRKIYDPDSATVSGSIGSADQQMIGSDKAAKERETADALAYQEAEQANRRGNKHLE